MEFDSLDDMIRVAKSRGKKKRFAVVAAENKITLEPVLTAYRDGIIEPILIGNDRLIREYVEEIAGSIGGITVVPAGSFKESAQKAVDLVNEGQADCIMKGRLETSTLMSVVLRRENNMRIGRIVSAMGIMELPSYHKILAHSDAGVNLFPTLEQKKAIIKNAVWVLRQLGIDCPKVAVLTPVEVVNPKIRATIDARALRDMNRAGAIKDCIVEGPISYDIAVNKNAARIKGFESPVAGDADVLVWPDVNAGNIAGKALACSAGARVAGLIVGAKVPIVVQSRASSFDEEYLSIALAAL